MTAGTDGGQGGAWLLGVDIGGTFTDLMLVRADGGGRISLKVPTVPSAPEQGVAHGLRVLEDELGVDLGTIDYFAHGMTTGLNTLLQRAGSKVALFVTEGFRDILHLQRLRLPVPFDLTSRLPRPLVPRRLVYGVPERLAADGSEVAPVDLDAVAAAADDAVARGVEGVAVCLLHSYRDPSHEHAVARALRERHPQLRTCCSADLWPQMREYERASLAVANLYVQKNVEEYFARLADVLAGAGVAAAPFITQSNGGVMDLGSAEAAPVRTLFSGPAAGVIGAVREARAAGRGDLITFDMGGTSTDISVVSGGIPTYSSSCEVGGIPVCIPTIDIASVGAGGGSVAWSDAGLLRVGPMSAGSDPGPACYGRSMLPTLTDAFLVCGYLGVERFGGGRMALSRQRSLEAVGALARKLGKDAETLADEMVRVAVANMYAEIGNAMEQRGFDPRELTLVAYGGGGPVLANAVAREIRAREVLVPARPGTLCASGALAAQFVHDAVDALGGPLDGADARGLAERLAGLERQARAWLDAQATDAVDRAGATCTFLAEARYAGQSHALLVPVDPQAGPGALAETFHAEHERLYGHCERSAAVEVVSLRVRIAAEVARAKGEGMAAVDGCAADLPAAGEGRPAPCGSRRLVLEGGARVALVYAREDLRAGDIVPGPAVIEQDDTTVVVLPGWRAAVDGLLNLVIDREQEVRP